MNNPSALSSSSFGSLALTKNEHDAIDPFIFMDKNEPEILFRLISEYEYKENEAAEFFLSLKDILKKLKNLRLYQMKTYDYLEEKIKKLPVKIRLFTVLFLLKVIQCEVTWNHAKNWLAQKANCDLPDPIEPQYVPEYKLMAMIGEEEENPLIFNESLLNGFHGAFNDGFIWESADIETFKDWFRVNPVGRPVIKDEMITYFCYAIWQLKEYRFKEKCPNIEKWYTALSGKTTTLSKLKSQAVGANMKKVDERIRNITRFMNG